LILFELTGSEADPAYQALEVENGNRQYDFLRSIVAASIAMGRPFLSQAVLKALNFHAIACLHTNAGEYRPCPVSVGNYQPPEHYRVQALMDDFVNVVNVNWQAADPVALASLVLWRLNFIHPFINGNGRTARAASYFVLCVKSGGWLPGTTILPELLKQNRAAYVAALQAADASLAAGTLDLTALHQLLQTLLSQQLSVPHPAAAPAPTSSPPPTSPAQAGNP
jgi:fido (protein-threonine AMPylation protein)